MPPPDGGPVGSDRRADVDRSGAAPGIKSLAPGMRALLVTAAVLVFLAGVQLYAFPLRTETYFAWTVLPPLTAVFLGASYWSSMVFEASASQARSWAEARVSVPTVFIFTTLTLIATLVHRDKFHFGAEHQFSTRLVTWIWLAIYVVVPVLMVVLTVVQLRQPGVDPPRDRPLPTPLMVIVGVQALVFIAMGAALFVAPERASGWWPWTLTPLTGRAIGAWVFSLGIAAAHSLWERDARRVRPAALADVTFFVLQGLALIRHGDDVDWDKPVSIVYVVALGMSFVAGLWALSVAKGPPTAAVRRSV